MNKAKLLMAVPAVAAIALPEPITTAAGTVIMGALIYDGLVSAEDKPKKRRKKGRK